MFSGAADSRFVWSGTVIAHCGLLVDQRARSDGGSWRHQLTEVHASDCVTELPKYNSSAARQVKGKG